MLYGGPGHRFSEQLNQSTVAWRCERHFSDEIWFLKLIADTPSFTVDRLIALLQALQLLLGHELQPNNVRLRAEKGELEI